MTELTKTQMATLLTVCAKFDGRTLDDETFDAWHMLLSDLPYEDVEDAIRVHYRADRRWIMPADIVAHHQQLEAARAVEKVRQSPPTCPCGLVYRLSELPGSLFALPVGGHAEGCAEGWLVGVAHFDPEMAVWNILTVNPATFDEVAYVTGYAELSARMRRERQAITGGDDPE